MSNASAADAATPAISPGEIGERVQRLFAESSAWLSAHWLEVLIALAAAALIVGALHVARRWGMKLCERSQMLMGWGGVIGRAVARTGNFFIVMTAARLVAGYAHAPQAVAQTIDFLFTVAAVFQAAIWAREIILGVIERRTESEHYHGEALASAMGIIRLLVTVALFAIALVVVLDNLGVNVTGLVAGLGIGGIAIGLAAQGIFADLFAALSIIFDRPFRRGDSIRYDQTDGAIEAIGLKSTRIRSFSGEERIISNKTLLDKEIVNNSRRDHRRGQFILGLTYQTPPEVLERIPAMLQEIVEAHGAIFVRCGFIAFNASSLDFELLFDTEGPDYGRFYEARTAIGIAILKRFNEERIDIAYPTQTTFTADPEGRFIMPYPQVQPVVVEGEHGKGAAPAGAR